MQGDIDKGLRDYPDGSFDYVVLNQTLQAVKKPDVVLSEILRVGKKGIVGFPNFAYWKMRFYLFTYGRMPKTEFLPFEWYDTPNIHFCSIFDFAEYCAKNGVTIEKTVYLSTDRGGRVLRGVRPNMFAENAVYLLSARKS
jgi:methionine biosynthesis protein MetW